MPIKDYSTDPDLNVSISGINIAEGCPPSGINNAIRQLMADVKEESEAKAEAITAAATQASSALEAFAGGQALVDAAQDEAIAEAKSSAANAQNSANAANQGLVGVVRSVNGTAADSAGNVAVTAAIPTGSVIAYAANSTPSGGFLLCNGAAVSRTTYAALFAAIGTTYGTGDDSTTFNLPNLTNRFIQGSDTSGTVKNAGLPNITGAFNAQQNNNSSWTVKVSGAFVHNTPYSGKINSGEGAAGYGYSFNASNSNSIYGNSTTVQPPALTMRYYIKY